MPQNRGKDASPTDNRGRDAHATEPGQGCPSYRSSLFPFGLSGGAGVFVVLVDVVLAWWGEDIEDTGGSLRNNA